MVDIYGTIGPSCSDIETLEQMFRAGMTGIRLNLSHTTLQDAEEQIVNIYQAAKNCGVKPQLLIDMQGPELRIGTLPHPLTLEKGADCTLFYLLQTDGPTAVFASGKHHLIPVPSVILPYLKDGQEVLLDDGKILLKVIEAEAASPSHGALAQNRPASKGLNEFTGIRARVLRGGTLTGRKSIALPGAEIYPPTMTDQDKQTIRDAGDYGVTAVMQPFVRDAEDLRKVRQALDEAGWTDIRLFAKIENHFGIDNLESFFPIADQIVIARGDLGNSMLLWELPRIQKEISAKCHRAGMPFMVVTQMLASMEHSAVPTRAEVSDIYNAVLDGAASVMVTGETAVGDYPVEVIRYLAKTAETAKK